MQDKYIKYTEQQRQDILQVFKDKVGLPFSPAKMQKAGCIALFKKLTGKELTVGGVISFLNRTMDPTKYKERAKGYRNGRMDKGSNNLYNATRGKYILVPSHGDNASYESLEEVKEAIEKCQSANLSMIKFKLLEVKEIKVRTTVSCEIS